MSEAERAFPAERLRAFRRWLGLSHRDVACLLGISTRVVQKYEASGAPEWVRYALLGWAVLVHGATPRAAARNLGFPWKHLPLADGSLPDADALAQLDDRGFSQGDAADAGSEEDDRDDPDGEDDPADGAVLGEELEGALLPEDATPDSRTASGGEQDRSTSGKGQRVGREGSRA